MYVQELGLSQTITGELSIRHSDLAYISDKYNFNKMKSILQVPIQMFTNK